MGRYGGIWVACAGAGLIGLGAHGLKAQTPGASFRDCADCPEMVVIPAGSVLMGSAFPNAPRYETPQTRVTFAKPFAIGKYEVTQEEWFAVTGEHRGSYMGTRLPVESISWGDVQDFIRKLNAKTGKEYRLPTEAEWEYAARADAAGIFLYGDDPAELDRYAWSKTNSGGMTHTVGTKQPNTFGLYDMIGNVYEWTADCYQDNHIGVPTDGSAVTGPADCPHVVKGGSYFGTPPALRPGDRGRLTQDLEDTTLGFRLARSLP